MYETGWRFINQYHILKVDFIVTVIIIVENPIQKTNGVFHLYIFYFLLVQLQFANNHFLNYQNLLCSFHLQKPSNFRIITFLKKYLNARQ